MRAPDFGHHAIRIGRVHMDWWGDGPLVIRDGKRVWWFEFSDRFGPTILKPGKARNVSDHQPMREDDPFWRPFTAWMRAGKKCRAVRSRRGKLRFYLCHWNREPAHD